MERRVAETASALGAVQHLYAVQEQLAQREAELAAMHHERAQLKQQVGRRNKLVVQAAGSELPIGCIAQTLAPARLPPPSADCRGGSGADQQERAAAGVWAAPEAGGDWGSQAGAPACVDRAIAAVGTSVHLAMHEASRTSVLLSRQVAEARELQKEKARTVQQLAAERERKLAQHLEQVCVKACGISALLSMLHCAARRNGALVGAPGRISILRRSSSQHNACTQD